MKLPERVDRRAFWTWVVPLLMARAGVAALGAAGFKTLGAFDTFIIIVLATLVAARFRDIGWRGWIGASFVIATMLVAPLAFFAYVIATNIPPAQVMDALNAISQIGGIANLMLLVVSGSVRGSGRVDPIPAGAVDALQPPAEARSPSAVQDAHREPGVLAMTGGIMRLDRITHGIRNSNSPNRNTRRLLVAPYVSANVLSSLRASLIPEFHDCRFNEPNKRA